MPITIDQGFPIIVNQTNATGSLATAAFSNGGSNRLIVAVVAVNGLSLVVIPSNVSGAGLTWVKSAACAFTNDASAANMAGVEIWTAFASSQLVAQTITATRQNSGSAASGVLAVYSLSGTTTSNYIGATGQFADPGGNTSHTFSAAIKPQRINSYIVGGFIAANNAISLPANSITTMDSINVDSNVGSSESAGHMTNLVASIQSYILGSTATNTWGCNLVMEILAAATTYNNTITEVASAVDSIPAAGNPKTIEQI